MIGYRPTIQTTNRQKTTIKFNKIHENAVLPAQQHSLGDAGFDLVAPERVELAAGVATVVSTGLRLAYVDYLQELFLEVRSRSGLAKNLVFPVTGTVDLNYRGEIGVVLANLSGKTYVINPGDRIAQLVVQQIKTTSVEMEWTEEPPMPTTRNSGGFGSTGR